MENPCEYDQPFVPDEAVLVAVGTPKLNDFTRFTLLMATASGRLMVLNHMLAGARLETAVLVARRYGSHWDNVTPAPPPAV